MATKVITALASLMINHAETPIQMRLNISKMLKAIVAFFFKLFIIKISSFTSLIWNIISNLWSSATIDSKQTRKIINEYGKI